MTQNTINNSASDLQVDNINIDANTISTTSGALVLEPNIGENVRVLKTTAGSRTLQVDNTDATNTSSSSIIQTSVSGTSGGASFYKINKGTTRS